MASPFFEFSTSNRYLANFIALCVDSGLGTADVKRLIKLSRTHTSIAMSSNDPVGQVAGRLNIKLSSLVLEKSRSELRGLQFQNPHGTFGKGDNELKRASAILEYVAREQEGIKIPLGHLAKAAYTKEVDFGKFHRQLGNFRKGSITHPSAVTKSSITTLAMKLGSHVHDSNGVAIRAQRLLNRIVRSHHNNPHQLRDIGRFSKVYEAVCFYVEATRGVQKGDEDGKHLQVATVVDVSTEFTLNEFTNILEHVKTMLDNMSATTEPKSSTKIVSIDSKTTSKKRKHPSDDLSDSEHDIVVTARSKRTTMPTAILENMQLRADNMDSLNDDPFNLSAAPLETSFSPQFLIWKEQVLDQAINSATVSLAPDAQKGSNSRLQALDHAVHKFLQSAGLQFLTKIPDGS